MSEVAATADICDVFGTTAAVCAAPLRHYGARLRFSGNAATLSCFEDNVLLGETLSQPGQGRVLVVDGGGSLRSALLGDNMAGLAVGSGWAGVIIHGAVRDVERLREIDLGVLALGSNPRRSGKAGAGTHGEPVSFGGITFKPGDVVYADEDGLVVLPGDAV